MPWQGSSILKSPLERCECVDEEHWHHTQINSDVFPIVCRHSGATVTWSYVHYDYSECTPPNVCFESEQNAVKPATFATSYSSGPSQTKKSSVIGSWTPMKQWLLYGNNPRALVEWSYWRRRNARSRVFTKQLPEKADRKLETIRFL